MSSSPIVAPTQRQPHRRRAGQRVHTSPTAPGTLECSRPSTGNGIDKIFARHDDVGTVAWYLRDRLGSVRDMTNNSGTVQHTIAYDGFGSVTSERTPAFGDRYNDCDQNLEGESFS